MQRSCGCRARAIEAVRDCVRGAARNVAQTQLRGSRRPVGFPAAAHRHHAIEDLLEHPIAPNLIKHHPIVEWLPCNAASGQIRCLTLVLDCMPDIQQKDEQYLWKPKAADWTSERG